MASATPDSSIIKSNKSLNPPRKVRTIAKIGGFTHRDFESLTQDAKPWMSIRKQGDDGPVFLETQSVSRMDTYELDYCYQHQEDTDYIYSREIKPLISAAFDGQNASAIALGARGSARTFNIQGSLEKPGLVVMAMSDIFSKAWELEKLVSISFYELANDQVFDLLNSKRPVVQVLEDAQGKINLRGLSQVSVASISEFCNTYFSQKVLTDELRSQRGLTVYISSKDSVLKSNKVNKINFVDLSGYEDPRKNIENGIKPVESNRANKSFYALLNVVSAINANVTRVPYRESKLTRILQDSFGGTSHVLLLACMSPLFCQDSISMLNLIARTHRTTKEALVDSTNRIPSSAKTKTLASLKGVKATTPLGVKKQVDRIQFNSAKKGRKIFEEEKMVNPKELTKCEPEGFSNKTASVESNLSSVAILFPLNEELQDHSISEDTVAPAADDASVSQPELLSNDSTGTVQQDVFPHPEGTFIVNSAPEDESSKSRTGIASPPLSQRIKEISDNLKSLLTSTTTTMIEIPEKKLQLHSNEGMNIYNDVVEPTTPRDMELVNSHCTPRTAFSNRSSRVKDSLVQDYLNFVNSANKEELKSIKGIGEKRATKILNLRDKSPEHFKNLDDLKDIGLSSNQIKTMMKNMAGELFN